MNYKDFIKVLKSREMKSVYLIYGEEEYLIDHSLKLVKDSFIDSAFEPLNYMIFTGKDLEFSTIMNSCETLPFMSEKKVVVIEDLPLFKSKKEEETKSPSSKDPLVNYIENIKDHIILIFVEKTKNIRKTNVLYKRIKKYGDIVECTKLKGVDLDKWIENSFKKYNKTINKANINYFIEYSSYLDKNKERTLYDLESEIIKIVSYPSGHGEITRKEIELLMAKPLEMNVFNLLNNISQKNGEEALKLFNEMYLSGEPILFILHMIVRQLRNMLKYRVLKESGYGPGDIFKKIGLSEYEYKKISQQSNNFTTAQLEKALGYSLEVDRKIKSTSTEDKLLMEILIANLCYKL